MLTNYMFNRPDTQKSCGGRLFYEQDIIYSYGHHFPIARIVGIMGRKRVVLFTTRTHSNTTGSHKSRVLSKLGSSRRTVILCADNVLADTVEAHKANIDKLRQSAIRNLQVAKDARSLWGIKTGIRLAADAKWKMRHYCHVFGIKADRTPNPYNDKTIVGKLVRYRLEQPAAIAA